MRLVFFGSGAFGLPTLTALASKHQVVGLVTQPDKPAGRGASLTPTPIGAWAAEHARSIPIFKPENVNTEDMIDAIRALQADAWVVIAFGQKLSAPLLADRFAINLHASRLPRWRGAAPIHAAVLAGDAITGNSVITLAQTMDGGLVLAQSQRTIEPSQTTGELHDLLAQDGPELVGSVLEQHRTGTVQGLSQDPSLVRRASKLAKADGWVDFTQPAEACRRRINGLSPWPGVTVSFRGQPMKLLRADAPQTTMAESIPGLIVNAERGWISCGERTVLPLLEVQLPGKKAMAWGDFARGHRLASTDQLVGGRAS